MHSWLDDLFIGIDVFQSLIEFNAEKHGDAYPNKDKSESGNGVENPGVSTPLRKIESKACTL